MWYRDYRCKNWTMFKDYENNIQYGISECKEWIEPETIEYPKSESEYLASEEEVEKALRKEVKRRGFVKGTKFLGCHGWDSEKEIVIDKIKFDTEFKGLHCGNSWIFLFGQWGTVVEEKTFIINDQEVDCTLGVSTKIFEGKVSSTFFNQNNSLKLATQEELYKGSLNWATGEKWKQAYYYHNSEKHGANFYELVKEVETKVNDSWKTFVIYKQLGSGLEFSREKEEFLSKFKQVYV